MSNCYFFMDTEFEIIILHLKGLKMLLIFQTMCFRHYNEMDRGHLVSSGASDILSLAAGEWQKERHCVCQRLLCLSSRVTFQHRAWQDLHSNSRIFIHSDLDLSPLVLFSILFYMHVKNFIKQTHILFLFCFHTLASGPRLYI